MRISGAEQSQGKPGQKERSLTNAKSVLGPDLTIQGSVASEGEIQLDGEIIGDIHCATLVQGKDGRVEGQIAIASGIIGGRVKGSLHAIEVSFAETADVEADVHYRSLSVVAGARLVGHFRKAHRSEEREGG